MKRILQGYLWMMLGVLSVQAKTPATQVQQARPSTSVSVIHPSTAVETFRPVTSVQGFRAVTQTDVFHPRTQAQVEHPTTQVQVMHPTTTVQVFHPQTSPQDAGSLENEPGFTANTNASVPVSGGSSQVATSMSDFKPMQAKDFSVKPPMDKTAPKGGGSMDLGNITDQAEKDNVNKSSLLGEMKGVQSIDVDPKQNKLEGLEKLVTDRMKLQEKK